MSKEEYTLPQLARDVATALDNGLVAVTYKPQKPTEAQQAQARANFGLPHLCYVEPLDDDVPKVFINGNIPNTKDDVLARMQYISKTDSFSAYLEIKCQGSSSMNYDKKNFTIKMYADEGRSAKLKKSFKDWNHETNKYVLKANYIDHTHARNIVAANLWSQTVESRADYDSLPIEMRNSPRNGAIDGFPIKLYANGAYQGIYTWNIGKDDWMWGMDEDNAKHVLLCAETNTTDPNPCNFTALWSGVHEDDWSVEVGTNSDAVKTSLNNLIACVMNTDDATFKATIGNYLDVQSAIDYILHQTYINASDNVAKNLLLATYDGVKWYCGAYDMDGTFGADAYGATQAANVYWPWNDPNQIGLWSRIRKAFLNELRARHSELRASVHSYGNMVSEFERFADVIGTELYEEDLEIYPNIPQEAAGIKYIRNAIRGREWYADKQIEGCVFSIADGNHTFTDGYAVRTVEGTVILTVDSPNFSKFPTINISHVAENGDTSTGGNGVWGGPEIFALRSGDKVRVVIEANGVMSMKLGLLSAVVNDYTTFELFSDFYGTKKLKYLDETIVMDKDLSVGSIRVQTATSVAFTLKIYVNGVRYV